MRTVMNKIIVLAAALFASGVHAEPLHSGCIGFASIGGSGNQSLAGDVTGGSGCTVQSDWCKAIDPDHDR